MTHSPLHPPGIMVSSTFYDLTQVREDLRRFISDDLGYRALLSEHHSFPVNPDVNTVENCRERVYRDADLLVLLIGRRYGGVPPESTVSVTNLEYLAAKQKGIPVFAFVDQGILPLIPTWKANPTLTFAEQVDTPKLFEFIETVRTVDRVWTQEFKTAQNIIDALRIQFAYQHYEGLVARRLLRPLATSRWIERRSGHTLRLVLEKPASWRPRLFASALQDAIAEHHELRSRYDLGIPMGLGEDVESPIAWCRARLSDGTRLGEAISQLINDKLQVALEANDDGAVLVAVADSIGLLYRDALLWRQRLSTANVDERFVQLLSVMGRMLDDVVLKVALFAESLAGNIEEAVSAVARGESRTVEMTLTVSVPSSVMDELSAEFSRLSS